MRNYCRGFVWFASALIVFVVTKTAVDAAVLHVPRDFETIQAAVDAAAPGDKIQVAPGVYEENVFIAKSNIRLHAPTGRAVLDGTRIGGFGIEVTGLVLPVEEVQIQGFVVNGYEFGVLLVNASSCRISMNLVSNCRDRDPGNGAFNLADGIVLIDASFNEIHNNEVRGNGHNGVFLFGTLGNTIKGNTIVDNGLDTGAAVEGSGIQLSGVLPNIGNIIEGNDICGAAWGILLGPVGPVGEATESLIVRNRVHDNLRAGIAIRGAAHADNVIKQNDATGNGLSDLLPSGTFDLFEEDATINNTWSNNAGTSNFAHAVKHNPRLRNRARRLASPQTRN